MTLPVSEDSVREILLLNTPGSISRYSDSVIGSNIRTASNRLELMTARFWNDRPASSYSFTTQGRAQLFIPGIRTPTAVLWQGAPISFSVPPANSGACWFLPDLQQSGIYTAIQLRVFAAAGHGGSTWMSNPLWFDEGADSPYAPWNRGGGGSFNSLPNDLTITGDWGYLAGSDALEPFLFAVKYLAAFYTLRPASILADVTITPQGAVLNSAEFPPEARDFVNLYRIGDQATSI